MKKIVILGSTGSIGTSVLDVVSKFPEKFRIIGLSGRSNVSILADQIRKFKPEKVSVLSKESAEELAASCPGTKTEILHGLTGILNVATMPECDLVVSAIVGAAGLIPTMAAIEANINIALANKEALVMAGKIIREVAFKNNVKIIPVDSEHSAIFQILSNRRKSDVKKIILTASGGPLLDASITTKRHIEPAEVIKHPIWRMGAKISVDSATLMNKGLEMIEARWLFDLHAENIEIIIHRQSIIHSMVEFKDGSVMSVMGIPDMRMPIAHALSYPDRISMNLPRLDLPKIGELTFEEPDFEAFPCLGYAYKAIKAGGTMPAVLNGANEEAVKLFLSKEINFLDIPRLIHMAMENHTPRDIQTIEDVLIADAWAREKVHSFLEKL